VYKRYRGSRNVRDVATGESIRPKVGSGKVEEAEYILPHFLKVSLLNRE
jgi:hypothetical protein